MQLDILTRLQKYCKHFEDYEALNVLRVNFLKNKQDLEKVTCLISDIVHDDSKQWGEDGYYLGDKVEIKNLCYTGRTKINGRVKFHDLNLSRVSEFENEPYWLVLGCYDYESVDEVMCDIVFGFKIDSIVTSVLRRKLESGNSDPELSFSDYKHLLEGEHFKIFHYSGNLSKSAFTRGVFEKLNACTAFEYTLEYS